MYDQLYKIRAIADFVGVSVYLLIIDYSKLSIIKLVKCDWI